MTVEAPPTTAVDRLRRHFTTRATCTDPATWLNQAWARAIFCTGSVGDAEVLALLHREWAAFCADHPGEPAVAFRPPPPYEPDDEADPAPPPYDRLPPLRHGRYGLDLPTNEERIRDEQERLARRDFAHYGF